MAIANKVADIISRTALHPFGHVRFQTGKPGDPWGFVGNEEDRGSGISDFRARPYRPELGVFLAVEILSHYWARKIIGQPAKTFAYAYAAGNPTTQADKDGRDFKVSVEGNHILVTLPVVLYGDVTPKMMESVQSSFNAVWVSQHFTYSLGKMNYSVNFKLDARIGGNKAPIETPVGINSVTIKQGDHVGYTERGR